MGTLELVTAMAPRPARLRVRRWRREATGAHISRSPSSSISSSCRGAVKKQIGSMMHMGLTMTP